MAAGIGLRVGVAVLSCLAGGLVGGCAQTQFASDPKTTPVVPLHEVIGSMKCGLARAIVDDPEQRTGLLSGTAKVTLQVNVVEGVTLKGDLSVGIPVATAGSFTPGISASYEQTRTNNTTVKFNFDLSAANTDVCNADYAIGHDAGFSGWIGQVVASLNATIAGPPKVSMQSYVYDSDFVVTQKAGTAAEFNILPVKGKASFDASRTDIQHLNVSIDAVHVVGGTLRGGSRPSFTSTRPEMTSQPPTQRPSQTGERNPVCVEQVGGQQRSGGRPFDAGAQCPQRY